MAFRRKEIRGQETLGERLRQVREDAGASLAEAAVATDIQEKYLAALEAGAYEQLPGIVYARAFLKRYAAFLTLNAELVLERFDSEQRVVLQVKPHHRLLPRPIGLPRATFTPAFWRRVAIAFVIVAVVGYLGVELNRFLAAPPLTVDEPQENARTSAPVITVRGRTEPESKLLLNGQDIAVNPDGTFAETVSLSPGINSITLEVSRKRSRTRTTVRRVFREITSPTTSPS